MRDAIESDTLSLRPLTQADAADVARILGDARVARALRVVPHPLPDGAAEAWIARLGGGAAPERAFAIRGKGAAALRGVVTAKFFADSDGARIGFWLDPAWRGKGVMTEAAAGVAEALFADGAPWLTARVHADNPAARRVLEKLGFAFDDASDPAEGRLTAARWRARRLDREHAKA